MSTTIEAVFDAARKFASGSVEKVPQPVDEAVTDTAPAIESFTRSESDNVVTVPVIEDWSLRNRLAGDFLSVQAVGVTDAYLQVESRNGRPRAISAKVTYLNLINGEAHTVGADGRVYILKLGAAYPAWLKFYEQTAVRFPLGGAAQ